MRIAIVAWILPGLVAACSAVSSSAPAREPANAEVAASAPALASVAVPSRAPMAPQADEIRAAIDDVRARIERGESAHDVDAAVRHAHAALEARDGLGDSPDAQELANLEVRQTLVELKAAKHRAEEIQARNPSDFAAITRAYLEAEATITDRGTRLIKAGLPGGREMMDWILDIRDRANYAAEAWAESPTQGFAHVASRDLLDSREFVAQPGDETPHWLPSPLARSSIDGGALVAEGLEKSPNPSVKTIRAGVLYWAPDAKTPLRNYELTLQFTVVRKGFTLLARKGSGFMNHSYGFETQEASAETRRANAWTTGSRKNSSRIAASAPLRFSNVAACFEVIEGKSYEVVERVVGKRVVIRVKPLDGTDAPDPIDDSTNSRSGGIAFQLLPGAAVRFERASIKILQ